MDKKYNPSKTEKKWYLKWLRKEYFRANNRSKKKPFVMIMPPPNLTGELHLGHALQHTITDILIRAKRMQGFDTLWLPGVDHAGIQMQGTMEKKLQKEEGKTSEELGRKGFLKYIWKWARIYEKKILEQSQALGESADWSRKTFTLDPGPCQAVQEEFIRLYREKLIYRGRYIVHWCPKCNTAITGLELEYKEQKGKLYYIDYPLNRDLKITIATTRPETMLGDTGIAVHPEDKRYKSLVGKKATLPLVNRKIPIVTDKAVDPKFGTGAVKVTPAHDLTDYEIGERHNLEKPLVIDRNGKMINVPKKYDGLSVNQARQVVINDLKKQNYLKKVEEIKHGVAVCERCKSIVEPQISKQWFIKMKGLAREAITAIKKEKVKFLPEKYSKQTLEWLSNIHDWCISRQLVWGHPMPVYYCKERKCPPIVNAKKPKKCPRCGGNKIKQETDVLDTWFSSGLWPLSTLGWPDRESADLKKYYPSDLMVTAPGILYLWICRMIILGIKFGKRAPFKTVFIHGTLRDEQGRKMSKSLNNGVDPLLMIQKYSADSLRFAFARMAYPGRDIAMSKQAMEDAIKAGRNFTTKVYNASKLIIETTKPAQKPKKPSGRLSDQWILSRLHYTIKKVSDYLETYQVARAARRLYRFFWNEFCDWYLEIAKQRIYNQQESKRYKSGRSSNSVTKEESEEVNFVLRTVLRDSLRMLHPFIPFITEEVYQELKKVDLVVSPWPEFQQEYRNLKAEKKFNRIQEAVTRIRTEKKKTKLSLPHESQEIIDFLTRNIS